MKHSQISLQSTACYQVVPATVLACIIGYFLVGDEVLISQPALNRMQANQLLLVIMITGLLASLLSCWLCMRLVRRHIKHLSLHKHGHSVRELSPLYEALEQQKQRLGLHHARQTLLVEQLKALQPLTQAGGQCAALLHDVNTPAQFIGDNLAFLDDSHKQLGQLLDTLQNVPPATLPAPLRKLCTDIDLTYLKTEIPEAVRQSIQGIEQISWLAQSAHCWLHPDHQHLKQVQLAQIAEQAITLTRRQWNPVARLQLDIPPDLPRLQLNAPRMLQVFINLIINACDAIRQVANRAGHIHVCITAQPATVEIQIRDNGTGIPKSIENRLFEPFVTNKPQGRGSGLGLAICKDIIETEHRGLLHYASTPDVGTTFTVEIPRQR